MPKNKLFDDNESGEDDISLKTANEYAKKYDAWREKEELYKLEQKYGDKDLNSDVSTSSDSEDEEPEEMTEEMEKQFLKTLSLLKAKDPRIYDPSCKFFNEEDKVEKKSDDAVEEKPKSKKEVNSLAAAFADSDDEDEDAKGEIFKVEKKETPVQTAKEDKLKDFLTGKVEHVDAEVEQDLAPLRALWSDPKLTDGEAFLRDYILNKQYQDDDEDLGEAKDKLLDDEALEADEQLVEEQGKFERAYNFRFEEPDQEYLKRYPRTMSSVRPRDDRRAAKRAELRTRKEQDKARKMDEIQRLKALKLKEIQDKIARIKEVTGNPELGFKDEDLEGEFDPAEHDRRMKAIFDDQYYGQDDHDKPVFPDLDEELEIENWDNYDPDQNKERHQYDDDDEEGPHCEDQDFNMDADYDANRARTSLMEEIKETLGKKRRNRKKKSKLAEVLSKEKPKFIPKVTKKTYDEFMEEYYKMDCEDIIGGDLPTRFKYREVMPNDFGLTVEEILLADDKELNQWASLKKTVRYRPDHVEKSEVNNYRQKAADPRLKKALLPSLFRELPEEPETVVPIESAKSKKKNKKNNKVTVNNIKTIENETNDESIKDYVSLTEQANNSKVSKRKRNNSEAQNSEPNVTNEISVENKSKKKKKHKENGKIESSVQIEETEMPRVSKIEAQEVTPLINQKNNKKKSKQNKPTVSDTSGKNKVVATSVATAAPSQPKQNGQNHNKSKQKINETPNGTPSKKKTKNKKNKKPNTFKNKTKFKKDKPKDNNPLNKLSDERLKAYGLNPKKYRNFMKYKKF